MPSPVRSAITRLFGGEVTTRSADAPVVRRAGKGLFGGRFAQPYDATRLNPAIPNVPVIGPEGSIPYLREQQALARHMLRNYAWIRSAFRIMRNTVVGRGPTPVSKFRDLEVLWRSASAQFDHTGKHGFGGWLRDDVFQNFLTDGEVFVRRRYRGNRPGLVAALGLEVPLQFQALASAFCPLDHQSVSSEDSELLFHAGIGTVYDRPVFYALYDRHPHSRHFSGLRRPLQVPASEVYHVFESETGNPRGEVMLATAFLRAVALTVVEDAEIRRKQIASIMTVFLKRTLDSAELAAGEDALPNAERIDEMLRSVTLGAGVVHELPPGMDVTPVQAQDEPENFEKSLRWQLLAICAAIGVPVYEVMGDWREVPERAMRIAGASTARNVDVIRDGLEHQLLNGMWRDFARAAWTSGRWSPPAGATEAEIFAVEWEWPVVAQAALTQEIASVLKLVEAGVMPPSYVPQAYFGMRLEDVARQSAKDYARLRENGLTAGNERWDPAQTETATSIASEAEREEQAERAAVEAAERDTLRLDS